MTDNTPFNDAIRVDAYDKVRGAALFAADDARPGMIHGAMTMATINKGTITSIDTSAARAVDGVRLVFTHEDLASLKMPGFLFAEGFGFQSFQPMQSSAIAYRGQPVAMVAADTLEAAIEAASLVAVTYTPEPFAVLPDLPGATVIAQADSPLPQPAFGDRVVGDADAAFASAPIKVDETFTTPPQHQNPMELIVTVAEWNGDTLIVHEGTQNANGIRFGLAREMELDPQKIEVISPYLGGGFGQKNSLQMQTVLAAIASRELQRPVKIVVPRVQIYHDTSFRPASLHHVRLGADRSGKMVAAIHETQAQTSRHDLFPSMYTDLTARLHNIENFRGHESLVQLDTQTPGFMRGPWEHVSTFAFESAVDELAYKLEMDPVALRLANESQTDVLTKLPFSSRHVAECLTVGAERFGWSARTMAPGSMKDDAGILIGWGVAIGAYPNGLVPQIGHLSVTDQGDVVIDIGGHEMGQGIRTSIAAIVARKLGVALERVTVRIGDTRVAPQHVTAGSWGTASAGYAAVDACDELLKSLQKLSESNISGRTPAEILKAAGQPVLELDFRDKAPGQPDEIYTRLQEGLLGVAGPVFPEFVTFSYIAHFVEVRIEPNVPRIRVPRIVSIADCGRVISPTTAESQIRGGVIWGLGGTIREASEVDPRYGGFLNADFAEYAIPVNLDIGTIDVGFVDQPDFTFNSAGVKGLGEVSMVGVAPAIANAVYHATGRRVRDLPILIEDLL